MADMKYLDAGYVLKVKPVPRRGVLQLAPGQNQDGYGDRISTDYMIRDPNDANVKQRNRWYRVFTICWSNSGSFYIERRGLRLWLRSNELEEARDKATAKV